MVKRALARPERRRDPPGGASSIRVRKGNVVTAIDRLLTPFGNRSGAGVAHRTGKGATHHPPRRSESRIT
jgi:hypothetical protein